MQCVSCGESKRLKEVWKIKMCEPCANALAIGELRFKVTKKCSSCREVKHKSNFTFLSMRVTEDRNGIGAGLPYVSNICLSCDAKEDDTRSQNSILTREEYLNQQQLLKRWV